MGQAFLLLLVVLMAVVVAARTDRMTHPLAASLDEPDTTPAVGPPVGDAAPGA